MLTRKQHELLIFIDKHLKATGFSPSFEEMKEALQLRSKSGIHRLISALEERGFLRRRHHRARALEVVRMPERQPCECRGGAGPGGGGGARLFPPNVIQGDFSGRLPGVRAANEAAAVQLPLYGRIAAGLPSRRCGTPAPTSKCLWRCWAAASITRWRSPGISMVEAGILDGDTVVIRKGESADNGQIIVALIDDAEVTLKRLRRRGNSIALEPANKRHEIRIFPADRVKVQGRLVALLRKF